MTEKRYNLYNVGSSYLTSCGITTGEDCFENMAECCEELNRLSDENEQLKKGMIEVVDRYIRNVEHNPPSSARIYLKVKGALVNVREGLRDLLEDLE